MNSEHSSEATASEILDQELAEEQAYVDKVYRQIAKATKSAREIQADSAAKYLTDRTDWLREEDGTALFERDAFSYQAAKRLAILDREHEGLVFGRLDLTSDEDPRYIGRIGVRNDDYEPLVIDWRAPAAEPFYRATAVDPMNVIRRRVLRSKGEQVIGIEDDLLTSDSDCKLTIIGEGALMAALKRSRGSHMRDIVSTIQAEQDEAIRAPYQGVTIISGGPGTGKTVVALHRAAYLLYTYRKRLEQGGVLVVGPSDLFMNYIERVLPSLGESSVTLRSMGQMARDVLNFSSSRIDSSQAATLKGSLEMLPVLRSAVNEPINEHNMLRVSVKGEILTLNEQQLNRVRRDVLASHKLNQARAIAEKALVDLLWYKMTPEIAALHDLDRELFEDIVVGQANFEMFMNSWWPPLNPEQVLERLSRPRLVRKFAHNQLSDEQQQILVDSLSHARGFMPDSGMARPDWSISDIALLDEIADMLGPRPVEVSEDQSIYLDDGSNVAELVTISDKLTDIRQIDDSAPLIFSHILVDESQDVTPMQWRMLKRRGPQASWTLVGDPAQSSYPYPNQTARAIRQIIGKSQNREFRLTTNYRSPSEVMELAGKVIRNQYPQADLPKSVRETGHQPHLKSTSAAKLPGFLYEQILSMADDVEGSIAVITAPNDYDKIADIVDRLEFSTQIRSRLVVITALQAKGLEYDGAVVVSPDDIVTQTPGGVRVLYVALTRPTQRLTTIDVSDFQPAAWRESLE